MFKYCMCIPGVMGDSIPPEFVNNIIRGDCLEVMKQIPDNTVDMSFVDPPYNIGKKYKSYNDKKSVDEYLNWLKQCLGEMVRVTKPSGSIFIMNIPKWLIYLASYLNEIAYFEDWIVWNSPGGFSKKSLYPSHYGILWYGKAKYFKKIKILSPHPRCRKCGEFIHPVQRRIHKAHPFGRMVSDVWSDIQRYNNASREDKHPTQLPVSLMERIILMSTDEGDIVLDPMVGIGTTCIAAKRLGRRFIGIEIDGDYVEIARKNVVEAKPSMFNGVYVSMRNGKIITIRADDFDKIKDFLKTTEMRISDSETKLMYLPIVKKQRASQMKQPNNKRLEDFVNK